MASDDDAVDAPWIGAVLAGGLPAVIRIPLPGPGNLAISLKPPQGWKGKSTCTFFIMQDKWKGLRLHYGFNVKTNTVDYHWNRKGFGERFPIPDHAPAGQMGASCTRVLARSSTSARPWWS